MTSPDSLNTTAPDHSRLGERVVRGSWPVPCAATDDPLVLRFKLRLIQSKAGGRYGVPEGQVICIRLVAVREEPLLPRFKKQEGEA